MKKTFVTVILAIMFVFGTNTLSFSRDFSKRLPKPDYVIENVELLTVYHSDTNPYLDLGDFLVDFDVNNNGPTSLYRYSFVKVIVKVTYFDSSDCNNSETITRERFIGAPKSDAPRHVKEEFEEAIWSNLHNMEMILKRVSIEIVPTVLDYRDNNNWTCFSVCGPIGGPNTNENEDFCFRFQYYYEQE